MNAAFLICEMFAYYKAQGIYNHPDTETVKLLKEKGINTTVLNLPGFVMMI